MIINDTSIRDTRLCESPTRFLNAEEKRYHTIRSDFMLKHRIITQCNDTGRNTISFRQDQRESPDRRSLYFDNILKTIS